jgi:hypothetical protein
MTTAKFQPFIVEVEVEVKLQTTISRSVYLGVGLPSGTDD